MCSSTMNGQWEIEHLPYSGGYYEQPAVVMEDIHMKISCFNQAVDEDSDD